MLPSFLQDAALDQAIHDTRLRRMFGEHLHTAQADIFNDTTRFRVAACGRRFGKTTGAKSVALRDAHAGKQIWWVLPTFPMATDIWNDIRKIADGNAQRIDKSNRLVEFPSGGQLRIMSAHDPDKLRGSGLDGVIIDEAAYCPPDAWDVLRPALSDKRGYAILISTPNGRDWFWQAHQRGLDPLEPDWKAWQLPSILNPLLDDDEIASAQRELPEAKFRQEYLAEFIDGGGSVFRNLQACIQAPPERSERVVFGVDWGRHNDFTVIVAYSVDRHCILEIERFSQIDFHIQRGRLVAMRDRWQPRLILAETNSFGEPNIEALQREGLPVEGFTTTAQSKSPLIDDLALAFEQQNIGILDDPVLLGELSAYTMTRTSAGRWVFGAPSGGHDDTVIALALAYRAAAEFVHVGFHASITGLADYQG